MASLSKFITRSRCFKEMEKRALGGVCAYFYHAEDLKAGDAAYTEGEREQIYQEIYRVGAYLAEAGSSKAKDSS